MPGSRYRKPKIDIAKLDPNSQEYWEEVLKREGLSMNRGLYPQRLAFGWKYRDTDGRNSDCPESEQASATTEDDYSEDSKP